MPELSGRLEPVGRVAIVVARYHERITRRLLEGALEACREAAVPDDHVDTCWVDGAFELGVAVTALTRGGQHAVVVALAAVVRGDTPHFDYVAGETAAALGRAATEALVPVGFGLLTCDTLQQATDRAGGSAGNKGREAAEAALRTASLLARIGRS